MLRFDVETISKATQSVALACVSRLRFDVETISKATHRQQQRAKKSCGLM